MNVRALIVGAASGLLVASSTVALRPRIPERVTVRHEVVLSGTGYIRLWDVDDLKLLPERVRVVLDLPDGFRVDVPRRFDGRVRGRVTHRVKEGR